MSGLVRNTVLWIGACAIALSAWLAAPSAASASTASDTTQFSVSGGSLSFITAPDVPGFPAVTLNGQSQTDSAQMNTFSIDDATGTSSGWNVTANGDASSGHSATFAQYCPNASCASDSGPGYVSGGATLPASSLSLSSTGAGFSGLSGSSGSSPLLQCASGCVLDVSSSSPTKIASAASGAGMGSWQATGFGASSLGVAIPTTIQLLQTGEVYRLDLLWTLGSGP